jgi:hypothetical protein
VLPCSIITRATALSHFSLLHCSIISRCCSVQSFSIATVLDHSLCYIAQLFLVSCSAQPFLVATTRGAGAARSVKCAGGGTTQSRLRGGTRARKGHVWLGQDAHGSIGGWTFGSMWWTPDLSPKLMNERYSLPGVIDPLVHHLDPMVQSHPNQPTKAHAHTIVTQSFLRFCPRYIVIQSFLRFHQPFFVISSDILEISSCTHSTIFWFRQTFLRFRQLFIYFIRHSWYFISHFCDFVVHTFNIFFDFVRHSCDIPPLSKGDQS